MPDVVAVVMGNDHGIDRADIAAVTGKALSSLYAADAGIEQEPHTPRLDINAIAAAPRLKRKRDHAGKTLAVVSRFVNKYEGLPGHFVALDNFEFNLRLVHI